MSILVAPQAVASAACRLVSVLYQPHLADHYSCEAALHLCSKINNNMADLYWCMLEYLLPKIASQLQQPLHWHVTHLKGRTLFADQISARHLSPWLRYYYFRFRSSPFYRQWHVILSRPTEFHPTRTTPGRVKTSY